METLQSERPRFDDAIAPPDPVLVAQGAGDVVSLRAPFSRSDATALLRRYFEAIAKESNIELSQVLTDNATIRYEGQAAGSSALVAWVRRFAQLEYDNLHPESMFDEGDLELYSRAELGPFSKRKRFALSPEGEQVLLVIPLSPWASSAKMRFGTELQLLLDPDVDGARIATIFERGYSGP